MSGVPDYPLAATIDFKFTTRAFATGIPTVLAGTPVIEVYEDNSTTQITAGETLTVDFDSVVGLNNLNIVATGANGYESGKSYAAIISTGTVGGVSVVGEVVAQFSIERSAAAIDLANGTDGLGAIKAETALILTDTGTTLQAELDAIQAAVITNAAGADVAADIIAIKAETALILTDTGTTLQAELDAIQAAVITNAAGADIAADIIAIKAETALILTDTGTTLDTKIDDIQGAGFSSATDSLEAIRDRGDAAWTTGAGGSPPSTLQNTTIATLASQVSFTLTAGSADDDAYNGCMVIVEDQATSTQKAVGIVSDYTGSTKTVTLREDPAVFTMATGDTIDVIAISHDILDILADTEAILVDTGTTLDGKIDTIDSNVDLILVDTGTTLQAELDAIQAAVITNAAGVDIAADIIALKAETALILTDTGTTLDGKINTIDTNVDAILVDTGTTLDAAIAVIDTNVDQIETAVITNAAGVDIAADIIAIKAETATILVDTGTTLQAELDAIQAAVITNAAGVDIAADIIALKAETALILTDTGTTLDGKIDTIDTNVDAILVDTAVIGALGAGLTALATQASVDTIDANVDAILVDTSTTLQAELDAIQAAVITNAAGVDIAADIIALKAETALILTDTSTTLQAELDAIQAAVITNAAGVDIAADIIAVKAETALIVADTNELQTDWTNGGRLDLIIDELTTNVDAIETDTQDLQTQVGTAGAGLTNITLANDLSATMKTSVQTAVDAAIDTAISELGVAAPTATPTLRTGLMLLYMALRNRLDVDTSGTDSLNIFNDAGTKVAGKVLTDDGTTYSEAEMA